MKNKKYIVIKDDSGNKYKLSDIRLELRDIETGELLKTIPIQNASSFYNDYPTKKRSME